MVTIPGLWWAFDVLEDQPGAHAPAVPVALMLEMQWRLQYSETIGRREARRTPRAGRLLRSLSSGFGVAAPR